MFAKNLFLCNSFEVLYLDSDVDGVGWGLPRFCAMLQTGSPNLGIIYSDKIASISMTGSGFECFCPRV